MDFLNQTKVNKEILEFLQSMDDGYVPDDEEQRILDRIREVDLSEAGLTTLPKSIAKLSNLTHLDISNNQLAVLPDCVCELSNLKYLTATNNPLTRLPEHIGRLSRLEGLGVFYDQLEELPESITQLSHLHVLFIGHNPMTSIPESIGKLSELTSLDLSGLELHEVPPFIRRLSKLKTLGLSGNPLKILPDWLGDMPNLYSLNLSSLRLTEFPRSLLKLNIPILADHNLYFERNRRGIFIGNTTLSIQPVSLFDQSRDKSPNFQESRKLIEDYFETPKVPIREAKVIFLGDGKVGKTYTIQRLLHDCQKGDYPTKETHGILIEDLHPKKDGESYKVRVWDFGGQDIMHEMHRCFLTDRTCYVVMVDTRTDKQTGRARYWLRTVQSIAPEAPVLLLVNEISGVQNRDLDYSGLRREFPNLAGVQYCSSLNASEEEFREKVARPIFQQALDMDSCKMEFPESWENVRQNLLSLRGSAGQDKAYYIDRQTFHDLCGQYGVSPDDGLRAWLLTWFNDLGVCFSYHLGKNGQEQSSDYKILDPMWLTSAVYKIIWEKERTDDGLISLGEIHRILEKPGSDAMKKDGIPCLENVSYNKQECGYVLDIMRKFRISYPAGGHTEFMPTLCMTDSKLDPTPQSCIQHAACRFRYTFLPENVLHRLMIYCFANLRPGRRWRRGFWLECEPQGLSAVIRTTGRDSEENELQIDVYSQKESYEAWIWLQPLCQQIAEINNTLSLKAETFILAKNDLEESWFSLDSLWYWKKQGAPSMQGERSYFPIQSLLDLIYGRELPAIERAIVTEHEQHQLFISSEMLPQAVTAKAAEASGVDLHRPFEEQLDQILRGLQRSNELHEKELTLLARQAAAMEENTQALQKNTLTLRQSNELLEAVRDGRADLPQEVTEALIVAFQQSGAPALRDAGTEMKGRPWTARCRMLREFLGDAANLSTAAPLLLQLAQEHIPALLQLLETIF